MLCGYQDDQVRRSRRSRASRCGRQAQGGGDRVDAEELWRTNLLHVAGSLPTMGAETGPAEGPVDDARSGEAHGGKSRSGLLLVGMRGDGTLPRWKQHQGRDETSQGTAAQTE